MGWVEAVWAVNEIIDYFNPKVEILTNNGNTVKISMNDYEYTETSVNGKITFVLPEMGTWLLEVTNESEFYGQKIVADRQGLITISPLMVKKTFSKNTWYQISNGAYYTNVQVYWNLGDTIDIEITDPSITAETYLIPFRIIGFNHDDLADGSGKAGLTLESTKLFGTLGSTQPNQRWNSVDTDSSWINCTYRTVTMNVMYENLIKDIKQQIKTVKKRTSEGNFSSKIIETEEKLFPLSEIEMTGAYNNSYEGEGTQYDYYAAGNSYYKPSAFKPTSGKQYFDYWLRSPANTEYSGSKAAVYADSDSTGAVNITRSSLRTSAPEVFAFCI